MKKITLLLVMALSAFIASAQGKKVTANLLLQYDHTIYSYDLEKNRLFVGPGIQVVYSKPDHLKPFVEVSVKRGFYFKLIPFHVTVITPMFAGASYVKDKYFLSLAGGPVFFELFENASFGIQPSAGLYLTRSKRAFVRASYLNYFNEKVYDDFMVNGAVTYKYFYRHMGALELTMGFEFHRPDR